jgi:hypothetical protein
LIAAPGAACEARREVFCRGGGALSANATRVICFAGIGEAVMTGFDIVLIVLVVFVVLVLFSAVKTVPQGHNYTVEARR